MATKRTEYPNIHSMTRDELLALEPGTKVQHDLGFNQRLIFRRTEDGANGAGKAFQLVGTYVSVGNLMTITGAGEEHRERTPAAEPALSGFETSWPLS
ncbi:hypothetical protein SUDANB15_02615 [Streptomyces sp. enrichment culture]